MAVSVNWSTAPYLITIPQSDCTLVSGTRYTITVNHLWSLLRDFSDDAEGMPNIVLYRRIPATASTPAITEFNDPTYVAQFEDGAWSVDIVDGNTNFRDVEVKNQVSVGTNNTTGFIDPAFLELTLFAGAVSINIITGYPGTGKTASGLVIGTRQAPSNNMVDALTIAQTRGLNAFNFMRDTTITSGDFSDGYIFTADKAQTKLTINPGANVLNCSATNITLVNSELDGLNRLHQAELGVITDTSGDITECGLSGSLSINGDVSIINCYSGFASSGFPTIENIGSNEVIVRNMRGSIGLEDMTGGFHSIGVYGGRVVIGASCSGGQVHVRGDPYTITDLSGGAVTILDESTAVRNTRLNWDSLESDAVVAGSMGAKLKKLLERNFWFGAK